MSGPGRPRPGESRLFVRDLELLCSIGLRPRERERPQRVRIDLELSVAPLPGTAGDDPAGVVDYGTVVRRVRAIATAGHIDLVETLAERIAEACLEDRRVGTVRVRVEKPDAYADVAGVGVEIVRHNAANERNVAEIGRTGGQGR